MNELTSQAQVPFEPGPTQFRHFLIAEFEARKRANRRYSLRAYARDLQIASSLLSRILKGKVPVTCKMLRRISSKLTVSSERLAVFSREVREQDKRRKERYKHRVADRSPERASQENKSDYQTMSFLIPCNVKLIPEVTREIQRFQSALTDFAKRNANSREPVCELHLSIRYLVEN